MAKPKADCLIASNAMALIERGRDGRTDPVPK